MTEPTGIPNVSMANTKKELLDAYEAARNKADSLSKELLDAEKARKRLEKQAAVSAADEQAAQDPVKRLNDLRGAIGRELNDLAERFEAEIDTYRKIKTAIETKREELHTIYEVETAASDLAALIEAQRLKKETHEEVMAAQKTAFEMEMLEIRAQWQREKAEHDRQVKEAAEALNKQRQREKEEHTYAFAREKEQRKNALADELNALEKEIAAKRSAFEQEVQQRTAALDAREEMLSRQENEMATLRKEVEGFPKRIEAAVQAAKTETTEHLTRDFRSDKALIEARFEGERNVLLGKIEALEKMVATQAAQIVDLSKKSELAYEKVQDIANRAVTAARREPYPAPGSHTNVLSRDSKND